MSPDPPSTTAEWYAFYERFDRVVDRLHRMHTPVIAVVDGLCYGAGMMLAAHCDLVIASGRARFSLIEARMGSSGAVVFPHLIGAQWTRFLILTGDTISARRAQRIGFVLDVVEHDRLDSAVAALAARVAAMPSPGAMLNKHGVDGTLDMMGWARDTAFTRGLRSVIEASAVDARSMDGVLLRDILRQEGLRALIAARDAPFGAPWMDDESGDI